MIGLDDRYSEPLFTLPFREPSLIGYWKRDSPYWDEGLQTSDPSSTFRRETSLIATSACRHQFARYHDEPNDDSHESQPRPQRPLIRKHGVRSSKAQKVVLDVNSLGRPGEVVIVPSRKGNKRVRKIATEKKSDGDNELSSIFEELDKEKSVPDFSEVDANIEEFRLPYAPHDKLNDTEWNDLRQQLEQSFTSSQLGAYISRFKPADLVTENDDRETIKVNWKPGTSLFLETDPFTQERISDRTAAAEKLSGKGLLAERILRDCWSLGIAGEVGQLDLHLPSNAIALLLRSKYFSFRDLAQYHQAKIDVTHSLNLVRVTGDERSCTQIYEQIQNVIARIQKETVTLSLPPNTSYTESRHLSSEFIKELEQNHGVVLERKGRDSKGTMYYLSENKPEADKTRRDIDIALHRKATGTIPFCTYLPTSEEASAYSVNTGERASLFDRGAQWFRWALPTSGAGRNKSLAPFFDQHRERLSGDLLGLLRPTPAIDMQPLDQAHISESLTARVGQCLFLDDLNQGGRAFSAARLGELSSRRIFLESIPRIAPFVRVLTQFPGTDRQIIHRFRLIPSISNPVAFPPIDLEVGMVNHYGDPASSTSVVIRSAKAVLQENSIDYLLPESIQDLRFTRRTFYNLLEGEDPGEIPLSETASPPEGGPLLTSIANLLRSLPFRTQAEENQHASQAFYDISLPKKLVNSQNNSNEADNAAQSGDYVTGTYAFPPLLKFRTSRFNIYDFHGERLGYSFYRLLPPFGEHSTVLSLDMDLMGDKNIDNAFAATGLDSMLSADDALKQEFHYFYNTACKLAFQLGSPGRL
ncbi:conserved hypothetical protein [Paecilomyces variotii No. 5]|uniref:Mitochondrial inner-membrane-bound regulator-domain-containing protein n=1 Tax=Byssochlamys spectabilis (strain No. 5 / NBRC 109023) TaxID=1356009 RepID=V5F790_BYSSN|nr:conserved hypothetical protein [Paecilomyces variotii No. 5]